MMNDEFKLQKDSWQALRRFTAARIALGRAGGSLPTAEWLAFSADHAEARDAVNSELDFSKLESDLASLELPMVMLHSQAPDRPTYLQRPDLGRILCRESREKLASTAGRPCDISITVADGLSALAAQINAPAVLASLVPLLRDRNFSLGPIALVRHARVAVMDEIGAVMKARLGLILIGERPGLGSADSLGAYLVHQPFPGKTDADRNCISNIRAGGLNPIAAAGTIAYLIEQILTRQISGVSVKDERASKILPAQNQ